MPEVEMISIPKNLAISISYVLAQLPAGQVAKMLIALEDTLKGQKTAGTEDETGSATTEDN